MTKKTKKTRNIAMTILGCLILSGCAGLPETDDQILTLRTAPYIASTSCTLSNSNGAWSVWDLPNYVSIIRDSKPLYISCISPQGWHGHIALKSQVSLLTPFIGSGNSSIAEMSDAEDPKTPYQGNPTNKANGIFSTYPGSIIIPMTPDNTMTAY